MKTGPSGPEWVRGRSQVAGLGKDAADRQVSYASKYVRRCNTIARDVPTQGFHSDDCLRAKEHLGRPLPSCSISDNVQ